MAIPYDAVLGYSANELEDISGALLTMADEENTFVLEVLKDEDIDFADCLEVVYTACKAFVNRFESCAKEAGIEL